MVAFEISTAFCVIRTDKYSVLRVLQQKENKQRGSRTGIQPERLLGAVLWLKITITCC